MKTMKEQLSAALDAVTNHLREKIKEQYTAQAEKAAAKYTRLRETFQFEEKYGKKHVGNIYEMTTPNDFKMKKLFRFDKERYDFYRNIDNSLTSYDSMMLAGLTETKNADGTESKKNGMDYHKEKVTNLKENLAEAITKKAYEYADESLASFKAKMQSKLEALGTLTEAKFTGDLYRNALSLTYTNATMTIESKVIVNVSKLGKLFNQYPSLFTGVKIDGKVMKGASELKVKKAMKVSRTESGDAGKVAYRVSARYSKANVRVYKGVARNKYKGEDKTEAEKTYAKILETVNKEKGYREFVGVQLIEYNEIGEEKVLKEAGKY